MSAAPPALAAATALLYAANPLLLAAIQARNPQHDPVRDPVSDYGVGTARPLFQAYGTAGTLAAALLALLFWQAGLSSFLLLTLTGAVATRVGVVLVPTDLEGAPRTRTGRLHMLLAVASFTLYYMAIDSATPLLAAQATSELAGALHALRTAVTAGLAGLVACLVLPPLRWAFGFAERVFLIAVPVWGLGACVVLAAPR